jgi:hypothetical protein
MKTYRITTIKDIIDQIPNDKLDAFFQDMYAAVVQQQIAMAKNQELFGDIGRLAYLSVIKGEMVWVDDGKTESFVNVRLAQHEVAKVTIEYKAKEGPES